MQIINHVTKMGMASFFSRFGCFAPINKILNTPLPLPSYTSLMHVNVYIHCLTMLLHSVHTTRIYHCLCLI